MMLDDLDGSGTYDAAVPGEITEFLSARPDGEPFSSILHAALDGDGGFYLLDGGAGDQLFHVRMPDGDGPGEYRVVYDPSVGAVGMSKPNTIVPWRGGLLVLDDGSRTRGLISLADVNGDGDFNDADEATVVFNSANESGEAVDRLTSVVVVNPESTVLIADGDQQRILRLDDVDGDGGFQAPGEVSIYFETTGDFEMTSVDSMILRKDGFVYLFDEDTGRGVVTRDEDGDGRALGIGEASVVLAPGTIGDMNDVISSGDVFFAADGTNDTVYAFEDLSGDGDFDDEGELESIVVDGGESFGTPSAIVFLETTDDSGPSEVFVRGDANQDQAQDISDAVAMLEFLFLGGLSPCRDASDADDSGEINISDPIYFLNYLFLGGVEPPPPFPEPGPDPSADDLDCLAARAADDGPR